MTWSLLHKKWRVLINALIPGRDFGVSYILANILKQKGCDCFIAHNGNYCSRMFKMWEPDAIFFVTLSKYKVIKKHYPNAKLFYCASEGGYWDDSSDEVKIFDDYDYYGSIKKIYMWSSLIEKDLFCKAAKKQQCDSSTSRNMVKRRFVTVGNPKLDLIKYSQKKREVGNKIRVGFIGNFFRLNSKTKSNFLNGIINIYGAEGHYSQDGFWTSREEDISESRSQVEALITYLEIIKKLGTDNYEFSIRPYPLEDISQYKSTNLVKKGELEVDESIDIGTWLVEQDVIVGLISTTMLPVAIMEKPYINLDFLCKREQYNVFFFRNVADALQSFSPKTVDDAVMMIENKDDFRLKESMIGDVMQGFSENRLGGSAIYRVAEDIFNELENCYIKNKFGIPTRLVHILNKLRDKELKNNYSYFDSNAFFVKAAEEFGAVIKNIFEKNN